MGNYDCGKSITNQTLKIDTIKDTIKGCMCINFSFRYKISTKRSINSSNPHLSDASHPPDLRLVLVLFQIIHILPPLKQHRIANELEPRSKAQAFILKHCLELVSSDIFVSLDLVRVDVEVDFCLDEEDIIDYRSHILIRPLPKD